MNALLVLAHPQASSFNAAMHAEARTGLEVAGHEVRVSDLYAMGFDPVSDRRNFVTVADAGRLDLQAEESFASLNRGFEPALEAEMDKLAWCDLLVLQFPLWWLGMPAILKGWIDRVFALGRAYGGGRWFADGFFAGKKALLSVTVGGGEANYSREGHYGRPVSDLLYPISHGLLAFTGFEVLEPHIVHAPGRMSETERGEVLRFYRGRLLSLGKGGSASAASGGSRPSIREAA
jgi:NAD(P)H dehydrogenase (quinone)